MQTLKQQFNLRKGNIGKQQIVKQMTAITANSFR